jgi:hypothetical protein
VFTNKKPQMVFLRRSTFIFLKDTQKLQRCQTR